MDEMRYQVVITGRILGSTTHWQAAQAFASLFSISFEEALTRFQTAPCMVRGSLSRDLAEKYCRVLQRHGIECELRTGRLLIS